MIRLAALALAVLASFPAEARVLEVGPGKPYLRIAAALQDAHPGDHVAIAPGSYGCASVAADRVTLEGAAPGVVIMGPVCAGKALLVVSGRDITVRNLTLKGATDIDRNATGIRAEGTNLTVDGVQFIGNENGILTAANPASTLTVRRSAFIGNGSCAIQCAHGIYAGDIALLRVEHSRFTDTQHGHHIKSRAERTEIVDCDIEDGPTGTASYLIDIPNGGAIDIAGNTLQKGRHSENAATAIMLGAEGVTHPTPSITVHGNRFRNDGAEATSFVDNRTLTPARLSNNVIAGPTRMLLGLGESR